MLTCLGHAGLASETRTDVCSGKDRSPILDELLQVMKLAGTAKVTINVIQNRGANL